MILYGKNKQAMTYGVRVGGSRNTCASLLVRESCEGVGEVGRGEEELSRDRRTSTLPFAELGRGIISARDVMLRTRV